MCLKNKILFFFVLLFLFLITFSPAFAASPQPLTADQAFQFSAAAKDDQTILLKWKIAPNYYLYQKDFNFKIIKPDDAELGNPLFPSNTETLKTSIGSFVVYAHSITIPVPIIETNANNLILQVHYQGCSKAGYCYPPIAKIISINLSAKNQIASGLNIDVAPVNFAAPPTIQHDKISQLLSGHHIFIIILSFLGFGILISFTPCVLPMIPILSSLILGKDKISRAHAFFISLFYVLGMSITYAIAGMLFGLIGQSVQALFQNTWVIACFSILFIIMALSLFGFFQIQLPEKWRGKIARTSNEQKRGSFLGALIMGCLSTLILSPCVTPPLVAVLGYIGQTSDAVLGGVILFVMGIGMGFPLLLIGAVGPKILPKTGRWMNTVKNCMGILMLAVAIFMSARILPPMITMVLWACLCFGTAIYFGILKKFLGLIIFMYGVLILISAYLGNTDPLLAWKIPQSHFSQQYLSFQPVKTIDGLNAVLKALPTDQIALLDFYADWCVACKELDMMTFRDPMVTRKLAGLTLLRVDVTDNSIENRLFEQHFGVIAPPTILFFRNNQEIQRSRIIGYQSPKVFLRKIASL